MPTPARPQTSAERLAERYGRRPAAGRWRRPLSLAAAVAAAVVVLAYLVWVALAGTAERADPTLIGYRVLDDSRTEARFTVAKDPGSTVRCTLQALDAAHAEVGVLDVDLGPTGADLVQRTSVIRTTNRAVTAVVRSCQVLRG